MAKGQAAASEVAAPVQYRAIIRGRLQLRDLIAAGRLAGVPVTAGMANRSLDDLPVEVLVGIIAVTLRREHPQITYDQALDLVDEGRVELVLDATDPKSTPPAGATS